MRLTLKTIESMLQQSGQFKQSHSSQTGTASFSTSCSISSCLGSSWLPSWSQVSLKVSDSSSFSAFSSGTQSGSAPLITYSSPSLMATYEPSFLFLKVMPSEVVRSFILPFCSQQI
ncbi:Hypothetical_protein [Hexamita inflata]|uniref:Hypothetical_protein n=1 Tax=Hexamita inflata TaxID=28002 RepID=A0AA86PIQ0_9EUKA|nr:Hypothetical protein HINF_LOCUS27934 [Hexamita inflata]